MRLKTAFDLIIELHNSFQSWTDLGFVVCHILVVYRGQRGPIIHFWTAVRRSDKFLTCQKFWSVDSGSLTVEAEQQLDSLSVPFSSLCLPKVANRTSECRGECNCTTREKKEHHSSQSVANVSDQVDNSKSSWLTSSSLCKMDKP